MRALDDAVRAGQILYAGISDAPAWLVARGNTLAEWRDWSGFAGLQVPYNLLQRDIERELLPMAEAFGMTVAAWAPLAGGILSGKFTRPDRPHGPATRVDPASLTPSQRHVAAVVHSIAHDLGATAAQVAIAWTRTRSPAIHPIGARRLDQLLDNMGALDLALPADAVAQLESATSFEVGYPTAFIDETSPWVFAAAEPGVARKPTTDGARASAHRIWQQASIRLELCTDSVTRDALAADGCGVEPRM